MSQVKSKIEPQNIEEINRAEAFWRSQLQSFNAPTSFQVDKREKSRSTDAASTANLHYTLPKALSTALTTLAQAQQLTEGTLLQGAWALLLGRYSGNREVLFGAAISARPTLPVAVALPAEQEVLPWLQALQQSEIIAQEYANVSLADIQSWSGVPRGTPLFESILLFESYPEHDTSFSDMVQAMDSREQTNYPLTIAVIPGAELSFSFSYDVRRFDSATIERMVGHFQTLLAGIVADPYQRLGDLPLLTETERHQILVDWNDTKTDYPQDKCVHQLFEEQVARTPEAVAVIYAGRTQGASYDKGLSRGTREQQLTYRELNTRANQLAHHLISLGVGPDVLVGICVERSIEMMVGLLAILKAGGAYVPLDPTYPQERLAFMLQDASVSVLLTQKQILRNLSLTAAQVVYLDDDWSQLAVQKSNYSLTHVQSDSLAYVIYTSGSTGQPKGVQIPHRALTNFLWTMKEQPGLNQQDILLAVTTLSFDIAALELYLPLIMGAKVVLVDHETTVDGEALAEIMINHDVTTMQATPATWRLLIESGWAYSDLKILCGGEAMPPALGAQLLSRSRELWNVYGPTETTIWSVVHQILPDDEQILIGRPIANTQVYILDNRLNPTPIGVVGTLYLGGDGLAVGYLNRIELTQERFIDNPFGPGRLYNSGDVARYQQDGTIECLGRIDHQVKLRGFRIELGEIEAVLNNHPTVQDVVVIAREDQPGQKRLVGYVVERKENPVTSEALRDHLQSKLPDYMVPAAFVVLPALPLTPNGKVDRKALPAPTTMDLGVQYSADTPRTAKEATLATIWQQLLRLDAVGIDDNFFNVGGDSIISMQLVRKARQAGLRITPLQLIQNPTIRKLAASL